MKTKLTYFALILMILLTSFRTGTANESNISVIAIGDGIKVTSDDIEKLKGHYSKRGFTTTEQEYIRVSVQFRLFHEEAKRKGLIEKNADTPPSADQLIESYALYVKKICEEYRVDDIIIESYYYSYPEKFQIKPMDMEIEEGNYIIEMRPLNEELKKEIRDHMANVKKSRLADQAYQLLLKQYKVRFCNENGCES